MNIVDSAFKQGERKCNAGLPGQSGETVGGADMTPNIHLCFPMRKKKQNIHLV